MPLYEYQCEANGHRFEVIQKYSDPLVTVCPTCGSPVHKLMSSPAIQFKGTGWYVTDYAKKSGSADSRDTKSSSDGKDAKETKDTKETKESSESKSEKSTTSESSTSTSSSTPASTPSSTSPTTSKE